MMAPAYLLVLFCAYGLGFGLTMPISRHEGDTHVPINCNLTRSARDAQIWKINNSFYDLLSLPPLIMPDIPVGIMIKIVEGSINQTTFQCFVPRGDGLNVVSGSVTTLHVIKKAGYKPPKVIPRPGIVLDYGRFKFNETHNTIAWKLKSKQSCTFTIQSFMCNTALPINTWTTTDQEYSLPLPLIVNDKLYFNISTNSECQANPAMFQIYQNVFHEQTVDVGGSSCLEVPTFLPNQAHFAVWPDNNGGTCTCPLCYGNSDCVLDDCPCYGSSFAPTWSRVTTSGNPNSPQLCWSNVVKDRNNTHVHFFTEVIACNDEKSMSPFISTSLVSSVKLSVKASSDCLVTMIVGVVLGVFSLILIFVVLILLIVICILYHKLKHRGDYQPLR